MNDHADSSLEALFRAARAEAEHPAVDRAQLGFETRLMARLREERSGSVFSWAWKLAPFFAALALAAGVWSRTPSTRSAADADVLAEALNGREDRELVSYMTGNGR